MVAHSFIIMLLGLFWYAVLILVPGLAGSAVVHFLLSLPMRRRDRARFFLDLLETALERGQPVEKAVISAAESRDRVMGIRFYLLAARLESGLRLGEALEKEPNFLPPSVNAMLRSGEKSGDIGKVLPACREGLRVAADTVRSTLHYMMALLMIFAPVSVWLIVNQMVFVVPRFKEVAAGMGVPVPGATQLVFRMVPHIIGFEVCLFLVLAGLTLAYVGGPGLVRWFQFRSVPVVDWLVWCLPWKRKKLLRIFSAMLAVLLDGGVPEAEAVRLAGDSTANEICRRRAARVVAALAGGEKLENAVRWFDGSGEFQWRLANGTHGNGGFLAALRGWHEALDARAYQQEETATQLFTSGLVIVNGLVVGFVATAMFGLLIAVLKGALEAL